jgi:hypothetical protein
MKSTTALSVAFLICLVVPCEQAKGNRDPKSEKYIDALVSAQLPVVYHDDGAADATVMDIGANDSGVVENPIPEVSAIVDLGANAIPLLIAHLDDTRLTSATFGRNKFQVPVGHVCLDILTYIIRGPKILVENCSDDGLGACVRPGYYFRPDAYTPNGSKYIAKPEVARVKANWKQAYRKGNMQYLYPQSWKPRKD